MMHNQVVDLQGEGYSVAETPEVGTESGVLSLHKLETAHSLGKCATLLSFIIPLVEQITWHLSIVRIYSTILEQRA